jgi:hypothetical protein
VEAVRQVFGEIELDPCSNNYSIVGAITEYRLPAKDGLKETWGFKTIFVNPPYGKDPDSGTSIKDWLARCYNTNYTCGAEIIALIPVATNTSHWKEYVWHGAAAICFLSDTRLKFMIAGQVSEKGAPMACATIYWGENFEKFRNVFGDYGAVVKVEA